MEEDPDKWRWFYPATIIVCILVVLLGLVVATPFDKPFTLGSTITITTLFCLFCLPLFHLVNKRPYHFARYSLLSYCWLAFIAVACALFLSSEAGTWFSLPALSVLVVGLLFSALAGFNNRLGDRTMVIVGYTLVMILAVLGSVAGLIFIITRLFG